MDKQKQAAVNISREYLEALRRRWGYEIFTNDAGIGIRHIETGKIACEPYRCSAPEEMVRGFLFGLRWG